MKAKDFITTKSRPIIIVGPDETAYAAIQKLVENNIGALPVCDAKGTLLGIISERDLLKECCQRNAEIKKTRVKDIMTREVALGIPDDDLDYVMNIMRQKEIRHLPIMDGPELAGMISARDVIEARLAECRVEVRHLSDYISGGYV